MKSIKKQLLNRRKNKIRAKISGTAIIPRFTVYVSNTQLSAQLIDDENWVTLISALEKGSNIVAGIKLGKKIAAEAKKSKISTCVFDRNGRKFHGIVKAIADTSREEGLKF